MHCRCESGHCIPVHRHPCDRGRRDAAQRVIRNKVCRTRLALLPRPGPARLRHPIPSGPRVRRAEVGAGEPGTRNKGPASPGLASQRRKLEVNLSTAEYLPAATATTPADPVTTPAAAPGRPAGLQEVQPLSRPDTVAIVAGCVAARPPQRATLGAAARPAGTPSKYCLSEKLSTRPLHTRSIRTRRRVRRSARANDRSTPPPPPHPLGPWTAAPGSVRPAASLAEFNIPSERRQCMHIHYVYSTILPHTLPRAVYRGHAARRTSWRRAGGSWRQ